MSEVTRILANIQEGDPGAAERLLPLVYDALRKLAAGKLAREKPGHTLEPTALVHEAYIRLVDVEEARHWNSRGHFFAAAAEAMRRILIESARRKAALKRGSSRKRLDLEQVDVISSAHPERLLILDEAISGLAREVPQAAEVVKLRLFAGLSVEEAAGALGISRATAFRHWTYGRAWLHAEVRDEEVHGG